MNNNLIVRNPDGANNPVLEKYFRDLGEALKYLDVSVSHPEDNPKSGLAVLHFRNTPELKLGSFGRYLIERLQEVTTVWMRQLMMDPNQQASEDADADERRRVLRHYSASLLINGKLYSFMWPRSASMGAAFDMFANRDQADIEFAFTKVIEV